MSHGWKFVLQLVLVLISWTDDSQLFYCKASSSNVLFISTVMTMLMMMMKMVMVVMLMVIIMLTWQRWCKHLQWRTFPKPHLEWQPPVLPYFTIIMLITIIITIYACQIVQFSKTLSFFKKGSFPHIIGVHFLILLILLSKLIMRRIWKIKWELER